MKNKPYLLLIVLTIVLAFILGVRYGQRVEKTNKAIDYFLSITPLVKPSPTKSLLSPSPKEVTATPTILPTRPVIPSEVEGSN